MIQVKSLHECGPMVTKFLEHTSKQVSLWAAFCTLSNQLCWPSLSHLKIFWVKKKSQIGRHLNCRYSSNWSCGLEETTLVSQRPNFFSFKNLSVTVPLYPFPALLNYPQPHRLLNDWLTAGICAVGKLGPAYPPGSSSALGVTDPRVGTGCN